MAEIKFSNEYLKFSKHKLPLKAMLLQTFLCDRDDLHGNFVNYDTSYLDYNAEYGVSYYKLPKGKLIVLLLSIRDGTAIVENPKITTLRRFTPQKYEYYKKMTGEIFDIVRS